MNDGSCTAGVLNDHRITPEAFGGHCFYVRRCLPGTAADAEDEQLCSDGGIILPPAMGNQTVWFECRAIGPNVGTRCSPEHAKRFRTAMLKKHKDRAYALMMARQPQEIPEDITGKRLFIALPWPLVDERVIESPLARWEAFVEETLPEAYMIEG